MGVKHRKKQEFDIKQSKCDGFLFLKIISETLCMCSKSMT